MISSPLLLFAVFIVDQFKVLCRRLLSGLQKFFSIGLRLLLLLFEIQNVLQNQGETQFVCVPTSLHSGIC